MSDAAIEAIRSFVEHIVRELIDEPAALHVTATVDEQGVLISVQVTKPDMGKVIGRDGQSAQALRTLLHGVGKKSGLRVTLKILEPDTVGRQTMRDAFKDLH